MVMSTLSMKRAVLLLCTLAAAAGLALAVLAAASEPAGAATDVLPDLGMARVQDLAIQNTSDGRKLLRFDSIVVNVGAGAFEVRGRRPDTTSEMTVRQRIYNDAGGYRMRSTTAQMYFAGDGHTHWHLRDLEEYTLERLDNGALVGTGAKHGFCFYDNYRFGSNQARYYRGCGKNPDALSVKMGLSRGWGDIYQSTLPDQYIDITGLVSGSYRLTATADAADWFSETNDTNNFTWVDIQISGNSVSVTRYGPYAQPISG
jgi:Lysyl oxidase